MSTKENNSIAICSAVRKSDEPTPYSRHMKTISCSHEPNNSQSSSSPPKKKNLKKLSLSTAAAQKLGPAIELSTPGKAAPLSAGLGRRLPMKLPALNIGLVRRPSLPVMHGKEPPRTPLDKTFSVIKELNPVTTESERENGNNEAYMSGPICIISPNLWLYSEPTAQEVKSFDVVINVAREVQNPLAAPVSTNPGNNGTLQLSETTCKDLDSNTAHHVPSNITDPSTEPENYVRTRRFGNLEYLHMPWDHNQALEADLPMLSSFIERNLASKRILIHCQQGVSRSATLVIAYIMKSRGMDVNEAYSYVKDKSSSIGPNMSLIYQLCEWHKTLQRHKSTTLHRRSFDVGGAKTAPSNGTFGDNHPERRKRATSSAERIPLERTRSEQQVLTSDAMARLSLNASELSSSALLTLPGQSR